MTRAYFHFEPVLGGMDGPPRRAAIVQNLVDLHLADCVSASDEVQTLLELCREVVVRDAIGAIGDRLLEALGSQEFEDELRRGPDMAYVRLRRLAALRIRINTCTLSDHRRAEASAILRRIDQLIHADAANVQAGAV